MKAARHLIHGAIVAALATGLASTATAADAPAAPTLGAVLASSGVSITGFVDVAYSHLSGDGVFTNGAANRVNDSQKNGFSLQQANLTVAYQPASGFGAYVALTAGNDADVIHSYDQTTSKFDITQAYLQYAGSGVTVIAGKFGTLAGAEVIPSTGNTNYSRSILFAYEPFTHTGVRATFTASDMVTLYAGVNNGWDQLKDQNTGKTVELGVGVTPMKGLTLSVYGYSGKELVLGPGNGGPDATRSLIAFVGSWAATDALTFVLSYDAGKQKDAILADESFRPIGDAKWTGIAGYVNYAFTDQWRLSVRAEQFDDKDGWRTGIVQKWKEVTATVGYSPSKSMELRFEARRDTSDKDVFSKSDGRSVAGNQSSVAVQALYKF
jgi:hypothetical protein